MTQKYLYDGDDIVAILDNDNNVIATITHDESIDTPLSITNNNGTFYYHRDHQGSIIALTDSSGAVVESFTYDNHYGTITNHTKTVETNNPYAYTGRELDTDELYYYRARYYDPALERFLGEDPIGFGSGDFNFYGYVLNSPNNLIDPQGENPYFVYLIVIGVRIVYIGITKAPKVRKLAHLKRWPKGKFKPIKEVACKTDARKLEQAGIERLKNLENKINSIAKKNSKYQQYLKEKEQLVKELEEIVKGL